jgi:hypothetical protein
MKRTGSITEDLEFGEHFVVMASPCYICMPFGFGFFFHVCYCFIRISFFFSACSSFMIDIIPHNAIPFFGVSAQICGELRC